MNPLITIQPSIIDTVTVQTCNARELYVFLESKAHFSDWIKDRIEQYGFIENQDYVLVSENSEIKRRGGDRRSIDYHLTLDMAKELSMVERNEKGKQARQYFIECERRAKAGARAKTLPLAKQAKEALSVMERAFRTLHKLGFDKNAAILSANQYTRKHAHIDILADTGNTHLVAENQANGYYTPTELGKQIGLSAQKVNKLLEMAGLQHRIGDTWEVTPAARTHCRRFDTVKRHSDGTPVQQVKWAISVLPVIQTA